MEDILQKIRESATTSSPPFTRGAGGDHILNHKLHFPNHRVHTKLPDYVSKFRSPSIPLAKGEEEKEFNSPPFIRGGWGGSMTLKTSNLHLPYNPDLTTRAKELRQNMTPAERKLWHKYLKNFQFRVLRQRLIDHFIVDFYCPNLKLVIEVDGESHYTDDGKEYDQERTQQLEGYGIKVIRFTNRQILDDFERVCEEIERMIPPSPP